ncbi:sideroflexin-4 isoform X2 [Phascolarctos cinereus]
MGTALLLPCSPPSLPAPAAQRSEESAHGTELALLDPRKPSTEQMPSRDRSFVQRFLHWLDILDPANVLLSHEKIKAARELLRSEQTPKDHTEDQKIQKAWKQSLATVHPDTGSVIPMLFRPAAFLPITGPLVFLFLQKYKGIKAALFPQFFIHAYNTEFSITNGNVIHAKYSLEQQLLGMTTIISTTFFGISPLLLMNRYTLKGSAVQDVVTKILPIPFLAFLSTFNVVVSRSHEYQNGIRVMDKNGNVVGLSQEAGAKAVGETHCLEVCSLGLQCFFQVSFHTFWKGWAFWLRKCSPTSAR